MILRHAAESLIDDMPEPAWIRTTSADDAEGLACYFETLSATSRRNRFMGTVNNLTRIVHDALAAQSRGDRFSLVAEARRPYGHRIVGEAAYAFDLNEQRGEFAISVADDWQGKGLGAALLGALQARAISLGHYDLFGETLKSNEDMRRLARRAGFAASRSSDWRAVRFDKRLTA